jgi:hypothetical protein
MRLTFRHFSFISATVLLFGAIFTVFVWQATGPRESINVCTPCRAISESELLDEAASLRDILDHKSFIGKRVRLRTELLHDAGFLFVSTPDSPIRVRASFDENGVDCPGTEEVLKTCTGFGSWYDGSATVTLVGALTSSSDGNEFKILCVEEVDISGEPFNFHRLRFKFGEILLHK